ncbi:MAG: murein L,D-transpeptidase catalytic domain-containing protein [Chitinophagaceae bacterium]
MKLFLRICIILSAILLILFILIHYYKPVTSNSKSTSNSPKNIRKITLLKLRNEANSIIQKTKGKNFHPSIYFLIDFSLPSGKNRFFVYDYKRKMIIHEGLVAHGSGNKAFTTKVVFSNTVESGCSSLGSYKISYQYKGRFGKAYKLIGLDNSNNNAFKRNVVLHAYDCVPDKEPYPFPICNSLGCPMVSYNFLEKLDTIIRTSKHPILLHIFQ